MRTEPPGSHRTPPNALAQADVWFVHNDWPEWRELTAADFSGMRQKVVADGRHVLRRVAMEGVDLTVLGG